jgi:TRAP-type C4-dicarboxylate transport system substrate-binding protein
MRRRGVSRSALTLLVSLCLVVIFAATSSPVAHAQKAPQPVKLTMISAWPLANITINYPTRTFKRYVEAWSGGRITVDFKGGTEIVAFTEIPKVTERGMFDISYTCPPYVGSQYPAFQLFNFVNPANQRMAHRDDQLWDLMNKITRNHGMVYLGDVHGDCVNFAAFNKRPPLDKDGKIESFKGMKIRTAGPFDADLVSDLGGTPVSMHPGEIYEAIRTKLVDGTMTPMNNALITRFWEIISYMTRDPIYTFSAMMFMNAKAFDRLSPEDQKLIIDVAKEVQAVSYNYVGAITWDGFASSAAYANVPTLSFNDKAMKTLTETRQKKLEKFAAAEPNLSKEIIEKFRKYYGFENLSISTDASLTH